MVGLPGDGREVLLTPQVKPPQTLLATIAVIPQTQPVDNLRLPPSSWEEFGPLEALPLTERAIFIAVIEKAILDYQGTAKGIEQQHRRSARIFLFSDNPNLSNLHLYAGWLFLDPEAFISTLRAGLLSGRIKVQAA